jgi:hypothetical protein
MVAWSASSESFTPLSLWDSTSRTLKHFRSQKSYNDFTVTRHADENILLSSIGSLRASGSITAKHYDRDGTLSSSQSVTCPKHPMLNTYHSRNEYSKLLPASKNSESVSLASYRFSRTQQKMRNANFEYNTRTRTLTSSHRRGQLPRTQWVCKRTGKIVSSVVAQSTRRTFSPWPTQCPEYCSTHYRP